jgi:hypothetical protein
MPRTLAMVRGVDQDGEENIVVNLETQEGFPI